jgi:hypothetical protein
MTAIKTPSSWTGLFPRFGHLSGAGQRFNLVGEELELSHVGCVEAWQRRHTAIFLLVRRCLDVGITVFSLAMCGPSYEVEATCPLGRA